MYRTLIIRDFSKSFILRARIFILAPLDSWWNSGCHRTFFCWNRLKNKRFTIFRNFTTSAEKANFGFFWAPKSPICVILTPLLFYMLYNIILHLSLKFGGYKCKNKDFRPEKPHFLEFFAVCGKSTFSRIGHIQT